MWQVKVLADTRKMDRDEWLEQRRKGIGGSDASAILGLNPYSSPLRVYLDKIGKAEEKETTEAMRQGTDLEEYVATRFMEQTGKKVKRCNRILQHGEYPWMLANIDRKIQGENAGLECKTTSPYSKFRLDEGEINPHYYWQSVHYMAVTGADSWYVAVLVLGKDFQVFKIDRNEDEIRRLIDAEQDFWENHVLRKEPPLPTGSDVDDEAIAALYPQGGSDEEDWLEISGMDDALNLRAMKVGQRDALDAEIKEIDQSLKLEMGNFQRGMSGSWKINWTNTTSSRVDTKLLKEKYPQVAAEVTKTTTGRRFSVSKVKEAAQ
jgi:putative phage-type endonuclease